MTLFPAQQRAVDALARLIVAHKPVTKETGPELHEPHFANAFACFGARGTGKSTLLRAVLRAVSERQAADPRSTLHVVTTPFDISLAPSEFPMALSLLAWLDDELRTPVPPRAGTAPTKDYKAMVQSFVRRTKGFDDLLRRHSVSADDYADRVERDVHKALSLPRRVSQYLDAVAPTGRTLLVGVDDVDLTRHGSQDSLVWSLLDELHQARLYVVLCADLDRLLAQAKDTPGRRENEDLGTITDIVLKVIPPAHRMYAPDVDLNQRSEFRSRFSSSIADSLASKEAPLVEAHLNRLLPGRPRSLEAFRGSLERADTMGDLAVLAALADSAGKRHLATVLREIGGAASLPRGWQIKDGWSEADLDADLERSADQALTTLVLSRGDAGPLVRAAAEVDPAWTEVLLDVVLKDSTHAQRAAIALQVPVIRAALARATVAQPLPVSTARSFRDRATVLRAMPYLHWDEDGSPVGAGFELGLVPWARYWARLRPPLPAWALDQRVSADTDNVREPPKTVRAWLTLAKLQGEALAQNVTTTITPATELAAAFRAAHEGLP